MTEQFYIAVKGSLHSSDSSVFGLTVEEVNALSKRYPDSNREVINGVLIKASPLRVINSLCELGYRVVCSSGETEIVWTLRREVLPLEKQPVSKPLKDVSQILIPKKVSIDDSNHKKNGVILEKKDEQCSTEVKKKMEKADTDMHKRIILVLEEGKFTITNDGRLENILQQANLVSESENKENFPEKKKEENKKKKVEKIGSKPEDFATYSNYKGPKIVIRNPSSLEMLDEDEEGGIIVNSNIESPQNPFASSHYSPKKRYFSDMDTPYRPSTESHDCLRSSSNPLLHQTLDEMDFERGIWMPAMSGDMEGVRAHLNRGTPPDIEDRSGYTPLHYAARCGHPQVCTLLIRAGASLDKPTRAGGATALHRAALAGHHEICCILLRYGANLRSRDVDGRTPLHRAVEGGHQAIIIEFLQSCPEAAFDKDSKGKSPLSYAEEKGNLSSLFVDFINSHS